MVMFSFLQIALTSRCNLACDWCPMKQYRNTDDPIYHLKNETLIPFLEKEFFRYKENAVVELTGGEPALYNGIEELTDFLSSNDIHTLIKTNGLLEIKPKQNMRRIAAFHYLDNPPKYYDEILIVDKIDSERKQEFCKNHNIPFKVIGYNKENPDNATHGFTHISFIDPSGHTVSCPAVPITQRLQKTDAYDVIDMNRIEYTFLRMEHCCARCKAAIDAWRFMDPAWK